MRTLTEILAATLTDRIAWLRWRLAAPAAMGDLVLQLRLLALHNAGVAQLHALRAGGLATVGAEASPRRYPVARSART